MTTATMALAELAEKGADVDVLRQMVQFMAQRLMELDVEQRCGAGYDEKTAERLNSRNGYRERAWDTRAGSVELKIPKLRQGSYFPEFLEPRRTAEKALTAVIQEAYIQGISTRSVDELVKSLGMSGVSKSQVSRLCGELDERVGAFLNRQIEGDWPYLWIDATYVKTREAGRIVSVAVIVAVGVNTDGQREVLGLKVGASEAEPFWTEFLRSLNRRGLRGVKLVISDSHEGIKAAIAKVFKATWQRCRVHFMRNALAHSGKTQRRMVSAAIGTVFVQESADAARTQWRSVADQLRGKFPKLGTLMDEAARAAQRRDQTAHERRRHLPQRRIDHTARRRHDARAERRVVAQPPLHATRGPAIPQRYCSHSAVRSGPLSTAHLSLSGLWTYTMRWDTTTGLGRSTLYR